MHSRIRALAALSLAVAAASGLASSAKAADGMVGADDVPATVDTNPAGKAEAFPSLATSTGDINRLSAYLDSSNTARTIELGIYADASFQPGALLGSCQISSSSALSSGWNRCSLGTPFSVAAGTRYWTAILQVSGSAGTLYFRQAAAYESTQSTLSALTSTYSPGTPWAGSGPAGIYADNVGGSSSPPGGCDRDATVSTFASELSAASNGERICLASGDYGTWTGTSKSVTIAEQDGAIATLDLDFNTGDGGFTIDGLTIAGGSIVNGANHITIKNSTFTGRLDIDNVANADILLDHNTHNNINTCSSCLAGRIHLPYSSSTPSGVTVQNSLFDGGNADGIQSGTGLTIIGNEFRNIRELGPSDPAHSDSIQLIGATGSVVRGNWVHDGSTGIVAYDGLDHATIEDNVVSTDSRVDAIELFSDDSSVVRHNTVVGRWILLDHKSAQPAGSGTIVTDNVALGVNPLNGSTTANEDYNLLHVAGLGAFDVTGDPTFAGGSTPTTYAGFALASTSLGKANASDSLDRGIRIP